MPGWLLNVSQNRYIAVSFEAYLIFCEWQLKVELSNLNICLECLTGCLPYVKSHQGPCINNKVVNLGSTCVFCHIESMVVRDIFSQAHMGVCTKFDVIFFFSKFRFQISANTLTNITCKDVNCIWPYIQDVNTINLITPFFIFIENLGDVDLDLIRTSNLLPSSAAKHRISVAPSNRRPSRKARARTPQVN